MDYIYRMILKLINSGDGKYITNIHQVRVDYLIPSWLIIFLIAGLVGIAFYGYYRNSKLLNRKKLIILTALRSLAYTLLLLVLIQPRLVVEGEGVPPGTIPMIIDGTKSMTIKDVANHDRISAARTLSTTIMDAAGSLKETTISPYWAGKEFTAYDPEKTVLPDGEYTSLARMLEQGVYNHLGEYCPGVILLSDGANNKSDALDNILQGFKKKDIPVYTCGIGTSKSTDIAVTYIVGEDVIFVSEKAKIYVNISQEGYINQTIRIKLYMEDQEVYSGDHELTKNGENSFPIEYQPIKKGVFRLRAEVDPRVGEITEENNHYIRTVRVIDEQIRVLMIVGGPSWEYRYLSGAFERDKRVTFNVYMQEADSRLFREKDSASHFINKVPLDAKSLDQQYDAIFISGIDVTQLPAGFVDALPEFVEKSGGLAIISDPALIPYSMKNSKLEPLIPISLGRKKGRTYRDELFTPNEDDYTFTLTADGMANQLVLFSGNNEENIKIWSELPPIHSCYKGGRLKPSSINLVTVSQSKSPEKIPAIVYHSYGKGTVLFMGFDSTWRWRKEFGDRYFRDFWGKAVQFLGLPHLLNEAAQSVILIGSPDCFVGKKIDIRARISNSDFSAYVGPNVKLSIKDSNETIRTVEMYPIIGRKGMYRVDYVPEAAGELKLEILSKFNAKPVDIRVMNQQKEFLDSEMNEKLLKTVSEKTSGKFFDLKNADKLLETLMDNRPKRQINISVTLWDSALMFILILIVLTAEWVLRKYTYLD